MYNLYMQAICAKTFGGDPSSYEIPKNWTTLISDYPNSLYDPRRYCDVDVDFSLLSESPAVTTQVLFPPGAYDRCDRESYCSIRAAIIDTWPGYITDPDLFRCNVAPTGDDEQPGPWVCVKSSTDACGSKGTPPDPLCPGNAIPGGKDFCVLASDGEEAASLCEDVCEWSNVVFAYIHGTNYDNAVNCTVFDPEAMIWASDPDEQCSNSRPLSPGDLVPSEFSTSLLIDGGAYAVSDTSDGALIDFIVDNCQGNICDITINSLFLPFTDHSGTYFDAQRNATPYTVAGVSMSLHHPVKGVVTKNTSSPWTVAFPEANFEVTWSVNDIILDNISLGPTGRITTNIDQITGTYNAAGALTLDISYDTSDATILFSLATL